MRVQVVVAHPDDETFGCGSLLLHLAAQGATTSVVCATRGEEGGTDPHLGEVREGELRAAATRMGVSEVTLLGYRDSAMHGDPRPDSLCVAAYADVLADVTRAMRTFAPDLVVTLDASDGHRDHARMRDAALDAAAALGVPHAYLVCLPRSLMRRWAEHMRVQDPASEHLDVDAGRFGTPDDEITLVLDTSDHLEARVSAIAEHRSQTSPYDGLPDDLRTAFLGPTYLRRVRGDDDPELFTSLKEPA